MAIYSVHRFTDDLKIEIELDLLLRAPQQQDLGFLLVLVQHQFKPILVNPLELQPSIQLVVTLRPINFQ